MLIIKVVLLDICLVNHNVCPTAVGLYQTLKPMLPCSVVNYPNIVCNTVIFFSHVVHYISQERNVQCWSLMFLPVLTLHKLQEQDNYDVLEFV